MARKVARLANCRAAAVIDQKGPEERMLGFVQSWFAPGPNPIGVDFGTDALRLAQVEALRDADGGGGASPREYKVVAAARADVPGHVRNDPIARAEFFARTVRDLVSQGNFRGRKAVLSLPAALMTIQHLRLPKMDDAALRKSLQWEAQGKLPYDPTRAVLRHLVAGEVYQEGEQRHEVILMAANREHVTLLLSAATRAKLDVVGMGVEPRTLVDCFTQIYRRKADAEATACFVDIGASATLRRHRTGGSDPVRTGHPGRRRALYARCGRRSEDQRRRGPRAPHPPCRPNCRRRRGAFLRDRRGSRGARASADRRRLPPQRDAAR